MPDIALWTTMISAVGAGASALGAVVMTNRGTLRRDRQQQAQRENEEARLAAAARETERRESWKRLLGGAGRVKTLIRLLGEGYQADLEERTKALKEAAVQVAEEAAIVGGLHPEVAAAAQALADATTDVVAQLDRAIRRVPGTGPEVIGEVGFTEFDLRMAELQQVIGGNRNGDGAVAGTAIVPKGQPVVRRDASSR
ncbi:hypothetical protein [Spirillospora sp. NPDC047279]|uniref:hypothetical protein n=1 Tax=Spirillospora sp. NPDC047279 TaxID=3155478 RepID=UPI0033C50C6E